MRLRSGPDLAVEAEDVADGCGFLLVDHQLAVVGVVSDGRIAAHPHALLLGGGDLVTDPLPCDLPLELGEGEKHVEGEPSHRGGGLRLCRRRRASASAYGRKAHPGLRESRLQGRKAWHPYPRRDVRSYTREAFPVLGHGLTDTAQLTFKLDHSVKAGESHSRLGSGLGRSSRARRNRIGGPPCSRNWDSSS